mmetsp:Transcript_39601/g.61784  ORF Transcript_39601/g.61784 Transcript_39601/m.61784 type:complete len:90 (-) Transcript_39601:130-399(-)|eukprot:CAMPEP_0184304490 /NCGR_PEP_ID=MMETSP1049-20130417/13993_1 /TAXON_ID=77928 /ORGANISM="Proteomonas sulcata, Strain CCMP704" /LENGTH=89 /DNA_ID=CAMNT_0026616305 /DNA_START=342 /DNA_END=611 /DNA_ORIENTATION=-
MWNTIPVVISTPSAKEDRRMRLEAVVEGLSAGDPSSRESSEGLCSGCFSSRSWSSRCPPSLIPSAPQKLSPPASQPFNSSASQSLSLSA